MKKFKIIIDNRINNDFREIVSYYERQQKGLGKRFFSSAKKTIEGLSQFPYYQVYYENIRCKKIEKFPYLVHYSVDEEKKEVIIHAIISTHQNPEETYLKM